MSNEIFLENNSIITSKTDLKGNITYGNEDFIKFSGFKESEFLNRPHNIIRHPDMPRVAFKALWDTLKSGKEFFAFVKNISKRGEVYWVFANITPSYNAQKTLTSYYSVRRCPSKKGVEFMDGLYKKLLEAEKNGGMQASETLLINTLKEANISYEELVISLQNDPIKYSK